MSLLPDYGDTRQPAVRARYGKLVAKAGLVGNSFLFVGKLLLGLAFSSIAIVGDSLNHMMDIAVSGLMLYSFALSAKPADANHPHGHGRAEPIMAMVASFLVISMGVLVIHEAWSGLENPAIQADWLAVALMLCFSGMKAAMAAFAFKVAKHIDSGAVKADAWNHLSDVMISLIVAAGVAITWASPELAILDPVMAIGIGLFVVFIGIKLIRDSARALMGSAPDSKTLAEIEAAVRKVPGVLSVHGIAVHDYGASKSIAMHIHVPESMSASDAHAIAENVEARILDAFGTRPTVHVDPIKRHCDQCELDMIKSLAKAHPEVISIHGIEMQHTKDGALVSMHVLIDSKTSIDRGHDLVHEIIEQINARLPSHKAVVHLEPCRGDCRECREECDRRSEA